MTNFSHRNLPHWVPFGGEFFITSCLKNAIPARKIADLQAQALQAMADLKKHPFHYDKTEKQKIFKRYFRDYDRLLANNPVKAASVDDWKDFSFTYVHPDWVSFV